jgi:hypothetical protein
MADEGFSEAAGMYVEGNIIYDAEKLLRLYTNSIVTFTNNIISTNATWTTNLLWTGPGGNNSTNDPLLKFIPTVAQTASFTSWADAQVMWDWFSLKTNSPAIGTGPNALDKGGVVPIGASISGAPSGQTMESNATLVVGINRTGSGIPSGSAAWPLGSGYPRYKWRLDTNAWSAETSISTPITLNNLSSGPHYVEISGRRDSGLYQDDPLFGLDARVTRSATWTVGLVAPRIESVARNGTIVQITFAAYAGQTYSLLGSDVLIPANWQKIADVSAQATSGPVTVMDDNASTAVRFYKLATPQQP